MPKHEHQAPSGEYNRVDYVEKMNDLIFSYDQNYYPESNELPNPQSDPISPGAKIPLNKVGISPVDIPILIERRKDKPQILQGQASLHCSIDDPRVTGLNLSRFYRLLHDKFTKPKQTALDAIQAILEEMVKKQRSENVYCCVNFKYPWTQKALRSRKPITKKEIDGEHFQELENGDKISFKKVEGHITYATELRGEYHKNNKDKPYRFFLTVDYIYSSTCPCSFELAHNATDIRAAAANAHSQRSIMKTTIELDINDVVSIEELIEAHRQAIPTEVQVIVNLRDEQAFAELNGANLLFCEDAVRVMAEALNELFEANRILDYKISTKHEESLHPWNVEANYWKGGDL